MEATSNNRAAKVSLPPIPAKRYFTIGEVSELCGVKPHVLRYWEQEFTQLKPVKRRGNRRYYQHHEVLLIRRIRQLLYEEGFTITGARHRLEQAVEHAGKSGGGSAAKVTASALRKEIKSVLDSLGDDVKDLERGLGTRDLGRLHRPHPRARQKGVGRGQNRGEASRRRPEALNAALRQRPIVVGDAGGAVRGRGGVADDEQPHVRLPTRRAPLRTGPS